MANRNLCSIISRRKRWYGSIEQGIQDFDQFEIKSSRLLLPKRKCDLIAKRLGQKREYRPRRRLHKASNRMPRMSLGYRPRGFDESPLCAADLPQTQLLTTHSRLSTIEVPVHLRSPAVIVPVQGSAEP